jgi:anti-sigma regulatory factor (Ser/Thr protein kinase)
LPNVSSSGGPLARKRGLGGELRLIVPCTARAAATARERLSAFLRAQDLGEEAVADIVVATGEALANAAEHGYRREGAISLLVRVRATRLDIVVSDDGPGFVPGPRPAAPPDLGATRGFGTFLMYRLMDEVEFERGGARVRLAKRLAADGGAPNWSPSSPW